MKKMKPIPPDALLAPDDTMQQVRAQKRQPIVKMGQNKSLPKLASNHMAHVTNQMAKLYPDLV